jgi:hypothetical protein
MNRVRAADDFEAIRLRLEELRRERAQRYGGSPVDKPSPRDPDAVAHVPRHIVERYRSQARSPSTR